MKIVKDNQSKKETPRKEEENQVSEDSTKQKPTPNVGSLKSYK